MSKRHSILPTKTNFFISSVRKIESVREFMNSCMNSCMNMTTCSYFQRT